MRRLKILVLMHEDLVPPRSIRGMAFAEIAPFKTEFDVGQTLREIGHEVLPLGVSTDLGVIRDAINTFSPHITFNLLEEFHGVAVYDHAVVSFLELLRAPYTGCNPRGLMLCHDKALTHKILSFHGVRVPEFTVFERGRLVRRPNKLDFPLFVKSTVEDASLGISQASIVHNEDKLQERVAYVHDQVGTDALCEAFIPGRELYVGLMGNQRVTTLPIWELHFEKMDDESPKIATAKVKWDEAYQRRWGIESREADDLDERTTNRIKRLARRVYHALGLSGYARIDLRMNEAGQVFVLEVNPNPQLAFGEDFADSAKATGMTYPTLIQRIVELGLGYRPQWKAAESATG